MMVRESIQMNFWIVWKQNNAHATFFMLGQNVDLGSNSTENGQDLDVRSVTIPGIILSDFAEYVD